MGARKTHRFFLSVLALISLSPNSSLGFDCVLSGHKVRLGFPVDWQVRLLEYDPQTNYLYLSRAKDKKGKDRESLRVVVDEDSLLDEYAEEDLRSLTPEEARKLPDAKKLKSLERSVAAQPAPAPLRGWVVNLKGQSTYFPAGPGEDLKRTILSVADGQVLSSYQIAGTVGYLDLISSEKRVCATTASQGFVPSEVQGAIDAGKALAGRGASSQMKDRLATASVWFELLLKSSLLFEYAQQIYPSAKDLAVEFSDFGGKDRAKEYDHRAGAYINQIFALVPNSEFFAVAPQQRLAWTITSASYTNTISAFMDRFEPSALRGVSDLKGFSTGQLRALIRAKIRRAFGENYDNRTFVDAIQSGKRIQIVRVSNVATDPKSKTTPLGFYYDVLDKIEVNDESSKRAGVEKNYTWQFNSKTYTAKVKIQPVDISAKEVLPASRGFDSSQMRLDGVTKGMVIVGSNIADMTEDLVYNYAYFLEARGYKFESPEKVENIKAYMEKHIKGDGVSPVDYLLKDAHLDKHWDLLLKIPKEGFVRRGIKAGTPAEEFLIVAPVVSKKGESADLHLREFADWFRERDPKKSPKLVYINGSCVSHEKARREVMALRSGAFQVIPTLNLATTFTGEASDAQGIIMDHLLRGASFSETRSKMAEMNRHYRDRSGDTFVFPDEAQYSDLITRYFQNPVDVQVTQSPEE